jgi:hypothetical protein
MPAGAKKNPKNSAAERYQALKQSSKDWDSRIKSTLKQARKASRRSAA